MYVMPDSTACGAAPESAQSDFPHSLQDFCTARQSVDLDEREHHPRESGACSHSEGVPLGRAIWRDLLKLKRLYVDRDEAGAAT